jgi:hypothetical protein
MFCPPLARFADRTISLCVVLARRESEYNYEPEDKRS